MLLLLLLCLLVVFVSLSPSPQEEMKKYKNRKKLSLSWMKTRKNCTGVTICVVCAKQQFPPIYVSHNWFSCCSCIVQMYNTVDGKLSVVCNHLFVIKTARKLPEPFSFQQVISNSTLTNFLHCKIKKCAGNLIT